MPDMAYLYRAILSSRVSSNHDAANRMRDRDRCIESDSNKWKEICCLGEFTLRDVGEPNYQRHAALYDIFIYIYIYMYINIS